MPYDIPHRSPSFDGMRLVDNQQLNTFIQNGIILKKVPKCGRQYVFRTGKHKLFWT